MSDTPTGISAAYRGLLRIAGTEGAAECGPHFVPAPDRILCYWPSFERPPIPGQEGTRLWMLCECRLSAPTAAAGARTQDS
jgi:hypothetical protein